MASRDPRPRGASTLAFATILGLCGAAASQGPVAPLLYELRTPQPTVDDRFGEYFVAIEDLDGDGGRDVAVCARGSTVNGMQFAGRVYLVSGRSGVTIGTLDGIVAGEVYGIGVADIGDADRDGFRDLLVYSGDPSNNRSVVFAVTVVNGARWHAFRERYAPIVIGDVDRDGWPDFTLMPWDQSPGGLSKAGQVELISGRDFSLLHRFTGSYANEGLGSRDTAGDLDGDGHPDILLGSSGNWPLTGANGSWAYSGRTYQLLHRFAPLRGGNTYGSVTVGVGDVDADGCDDVGVTDWGARVGGGGPFFVDVFSGRTGALLFTLNASAAGLAPAGDIDGDGHGDILMSSGYVHLAYSGRDQSVLLDMSLPGNRADGGWPRSLGDVNGDDIPDACVGTFRDPNWARFLRVYSGAPQGIATLGVGCADRDGVVPRIGSSGSPERGRTIELHVSRVPSGQPVALVLGFSDVAWHGLSLPHDLAGIGMQGCLLRTSVEVLLAATTSGAQAHGRATLPLTIPALPQLQGVDVFAQWLVFGRGAAGRIGSITRALRATIR